MYCELKGNTQNPKEGQQRNCHCGAIGTVFSEEEENWFVVKREPVAAKRKPIARSKRIPVAAKRKPVAAKRKPVAAKRKPVAAKRKPVGRRGNR